MPSIRFWSVIAVGLVAFALGYFPQFRFYSGLTLLAVMPFAILANSTRVERWLSKAIEM